MAYEPKKRTSRFSKPEGITVTQVCKCPNDKTYNIKELWISNTSANQVTYSLTIRKYDQTENDGSGITYSLINENTLASDAYLRLDSVDITLEREDVLNIEVSEADVVHVSVFLDEYSTLGR